MKDAREKKKEELDGLMEQLNQDQLTTVFCFISAMAEKKETNPELRFYSLREIQPMLGVTYRTLQSWVASGYLPCVKIGGRWKVKEADLQQFLAEQLRNR